MQVEEKQGVHIIKANLKTVCLVIQWATRPFSVNNNTDMIYL